MPQVAPVFERANTVLALDLAATVIDVKLIHFLKIRRPNCNQCVVCAFGIRKIIPCLSQDLHIMF
jgi:hypothetical protein